MKKKMNSLSDLSDLGGFVYSTGDAPTFDDGEDNENLAPEDQLLEVHIEKKGRGGKSAVLVKGYEGSEDELKELAKALKSKLAQGGSVKNGEIILQGNRRDDVMDFLKSKGYKVKRVGG